jgi:hypothetical protein
MHNTSSSNQPEEIVMPQRTHPPESDLLIPLPGDADRWDPHTIHTQYFGFCVPEVQIGVFTYIRYHPHFPLCQGGVLVFQGLDNLTSNDMVFQDYQVTMPWPSVDGNAFTTANGLRYDFVEPGRRVLITYRSTDGEASIDVEGTAVTPLAARGHVMPGEEQHVDQQPGGSEQFMRYAGELVVRGERLPVECVYARDRSWRQVRREGRDANRHPPVSWTPIYLDHGLAFNQVGFEAPDTSPAAAAAYPLPDGAPTHHFAWISRGGDIEDVNEVHCAVNAYHPVLLAPLQMEIQAVDAAGNRYGFVGEALACTPIPMWPNIAAFDSVFRWTDGHGHVGYGAVQTVWNQRVQHVLKAGRRAMAAH